MSRGFQFLTTAMLLKQAFPPDLGSSASQYFCHCALWKSESCTISCRRYPGGPVAQSYSDKSGSRRAPKVAGNKKNKKQKKPQSPDPNRLRHPHHPPTPSMSLVHLSQGRGAKSGAVQQLYLFIVPARRRRLAL